MEKKNHQAPFTQGRALHPGACPPPRGAPLSISKASNHHHLHFTCPPPIAWGSLSLFVHTADPPSPLRPRPEGPSYPSTPLGYGGLGVQPLASVWAFGDHPGSQTEVRIKQDFTSVPESSWLHCKKWFAIFPSPAGMSLTKLSLGGNIPSQGEFSR
jgi:hypothetical protein